MFSGPNPRVGGVSFLLVCVCACPDSDFVEEVACFYFSSFNVLCPNLVVGGLRLRRCRRIVGLCGLLSAFASARLRLPRRCLLSLSRDIDRTMCSHLRLVFNAMLTR